MKKIITLFLFLQSVLLYSEIQIYGGPHFNYIRIEDNDISEGYMGGVTVGGEYDFLCFFSNLDFEGSWNAGPVSSNLYDRSSLTEYFVEGKLGGVFSLGCGQLKPYTGISYDHFVKETNSLFGDVLLDYDKLSIPLGFYAYLYLSSSVKCGVQFEWRPDVKSWLNLPVLGTYDADLEGAFRMQIPLEVIYPWYVFSCQLKVIPFFDWNRYGEVFIPHPLDFFSLYYPPLTRWDIGLRVLLGLSF